MERYKQLIEAGLAAYLEQQTGSLAELKRYALAGGKRIRGQLVLAWCEHCGGRAEDALGYALAAELVQAMSLIHDDLPCMDNADERRGRPSLHKRFGEAEALLTGDALLADAFLLAAGEDPNASGFRPATIALAFASARMASGQAEELAGSGCWHSIASGKTASLIAAACEMGAIAGGGDSAAREKARAYGRSLGLAYQLADDIRDGDGAATTMDEPQAALHELLGECAVYGGGEAAKWLRALPKAICEGVIA